jgi:hypothetical protein
MNVRKSDRLPLSFHMTFQPERQYLGALLRDVQSSDGGTIEEISARTGIPTGKSTGKVKPHVQYAQGMGLLEVETLRGTGKLKLQLTQLGRTILAEDPHLLEENTLWALHLMLCRRLGGAESWYGVFVVAAAALGSNFSVERFEEFLSNRYGSSREAVGPLLRTYADIAALGKIGAIRQDGEQFLLRKVPMQPALFDTVGALLFLAWDQCATGESHQISLKELEGCSGLITATGWGVEDQSVFLSALETAGMLGVDRQTGAPILTRLVSTDHALEVMYDRLV